MQEVKDLRRAYSFWSDPPPSYRELLKDPRVVQQLHELERNAKKDSDQYGVFVQGFCDDRGVGRREPDPKVPKRPAGLP